MKLAVDVRGCEVSPALVEAMVEQRLRGYHHHISHGVVTVRRMDEVDQPLECDIEVEIRGWGTLVLHSTADGEHLAVDRAATRLVEALEAFVLDRPSFAPTVEPTPLPTY